MSVRIFLALVILSTSVLADVLPPQAADMAERYRNNPNVFDRTDAWCEGRGVAAACSIPGNAFKGGGSGTCEREIHRSDFKIDLLCRLQPAPHVDRAIPQGAWQAHGPWCEQAAAQEDTAQVLKAQGIVCNQPPVASDRFCADLQPSQACEAEVSVGGRSMHFKGVCRPGQQTRSVYLQGRKTLTRPVLTCEPEQAVQAPALKPVSFWHKLFQ